ncbi:MAG TPA: bifunctional metallophosphatase/5'-nucleotidase [Bacteroidetes bacterium]|nr:bifunctional metallophosphatase/5'-nucleotidase [Bacteroidota bacterium]
MIRKLRLRSFALLLFLSLPVLRAPLFGQEHIRLLHWSDFHAANQYQKITGENGTYLRGGAALLAGALESFRREGVPVAAIHAGDEFQGTPICSITKGESQMLLLQMLRPDVFAPGNHDFDYGKIRLRQLLAKYPLPVVCANLWSKPDGRLYFPAYRILQLGKVKVGVIGLITPELGRLVLKGNISGLKLLDPVKTVRHYVHLLRDSVDVLVVASHMGIEEDRRLAEAFSGIDLILGGHSHTVMRKIERVNGVWISHAGARGRYLDRVDLWVDTDADSIVRLERELMEVTSRRFSPDSSVQSVVDSLEAIVDKDLNVQVAVLQRDWKRVYRGESNIGDWIADAYRDYTGADMAFHNSGGIRKNLPAGPVTKRDFWEITPFENYIVTFELTGRELLTLLENNFDGRGEFLQLSGLRVWVDLSAPVGKRVKKVLVNGKPLDPDRVYTAATNNFIYGHLYETTGLSPRGRKARYWDKVDHDILIDYAKKQRVIDGKVDGRIVVVN